MPIYFFVDKVVYSIRKKIVLNPSVKRTVCTVYLGNIWLQTVNLTVRSQVIQTGHYQLGYNRILNILQITWPRPTKNTIASDFNNIEFFLKLRWSSLCLTSSFIQLIVCKLRHICMDAKAELSTLNIIKILS